MTALPSGSQPPRAPDRAAAARHLDLVRAWHRHGRAQSVMFLDPHLSDDAPVAQAIREAGPDVSVHHEPFHALAAAGEEHPDVLILSCAVPAADAVRTVLAFRDQLRRPVLLALGTGDVEDATEVIVAGARPVLELPYRIEELLEQLAALKPAERAPERIEIGPLMVDASRFEARLHGRRLDLGPRDLILLHALAQRGGELLTPEELRDAVWRNSPVAPSSLPPAITRLRRRLADAGVSGVIQNLRGVGYRLELDQLRAADPRER